jgi:ATP-dependent DNA helicase RecQ
MDILRGKKTEKVIQFGHDRLSTFGIGAELSEAQLRGVLRQLIATGALAVDGQAFNTLQLTDGSRAVLKGETAVRLRESVSQPARSRRRSGTAKAAPAVAAGLTEAGQSRFAALKAWRAEIARRHNLPAYVIFHDAPWPWRCRARWTFWRHQRHGVKKLGVWGGGVAGAGVA